LHGNNWEHTELDGQRLIDRALKPSRIYAKAIVAMTGGWSLKRQPKATLHGAAHISGGGLPEKLGRALKPSGFGASVSSPFEPNALRTYCQQVGVSDYEAYRTWHMGQGMVLISPSYEEVIDVANEYDIEAKVIGNVTKKSGIVINSQGLNGSLLQY